MKPEVSADAACGWKELPQCLQRYILALSGNHHAGMLSKDLCMTTWQWADVSQWLLTRRRSCSQLSKALRAAVCSKRRDVCDMLLQQEYPYADPQHAKHSAVNAAARMGSMDYVAMLYDHMEATKELRKYRWCGCVNKGPIYIACAAGQMPVLAWLLEHWDPERDIVWFAESYNKFIKWSVINGQLGPVVYMLHGLKMPCKEVWQNALWTAAPCGHLEIVSWLLLHMDPQGLEPDVPLILDIIGKCSQDKLQVAMLLTTANARRVEPAPVRLGNGIVSRIVKDSNHNNTNNHNGEHNNNSNNNGSNRSNNHYHSNYNGYTKAPNGSLSTG